jgi:hypothetical protein
MTGGLRWPTRPFQVTCVLVAVLLTAASFTFGGHHARPIISSLLTRLEPGAIAIARDNSSTGYRLTAGDFSAAGDARGISSIRAANGKNRRQERMPGDAIKFSTTEPMSSRVGEARGESEQSVAIGA